MSTADLQKFRELLTGYLNTTLEAADQAFMDTWMQHHAHEHPESLDELQWLALTRQQLRDSTPQINPEAGWHELLARIDATPRLLAAQPPGNTAPAHWLSRLARWWSTPAFAATACAVVAAQTIALWVLWPVAGDSVRLMSSRPSASHAAEAPAVATIQIVFKDQASVSQVREALAKVQGHITQGPSALGVWRMAVPQASLAQTLQQLRTQSAVESAAIEP